jgi:hypothetical protein
MAYEKTSEKLIALANEFAADLKIRSFLNEVGLRLGRLVTDLEPSYEIIWNSAGSQIEEYNKAEAELKAAEEDLAQKRAELKRAITAWRFFPFSRLPAPDSQSAEGAIALATSFGIAFVVALIFAWDPSLNWILSGDIPSFSNIFSPLATLGFFVTLIAAVTVKSAERRFHNRMDEFNKTANIAELRKLLQEASHQVDVSLRVNGIEPATREIINKYLGVSYETELPLVEARGLGEVYEDSFELETDAQKRLFDMLNTMEGGSIGISGPRGAGKTTLMRMFCDDRAFQLRGRAVLSVMIPAPAKYDAREFILHLFSSVCGRLCNQNNIDVGKIIWTEEHNRLQLAKYLLGGLAKGKIFLRMAGGALLFFAIVFVGVAVTVAFTAPDGTPSASVTPPTGATSPAAAPPTIAPVSGATASPPSAMAAPTGATLPRAGTAAPATGTPPSDTGASSPAQLGNTAKATAGSNELRTLTVLTGVGITPGSLLLWGAVLFALSFLPDLFERLQTERAALDDKLRGDRVTFQHALSLSKSDRVTRALRWLRTIKFQQSYTEGWSGALKFPIGIDGGLKRDFSISERPLSLPEIVSSFTGFLRDLSGEYLVIIGIDELDKIHPDQAAEDFLNDIKVIFGVSGVFYFISVSENVLSSFERRGIPLRNAFDSCFDEVLRVKYLTLGDAMKLIRRRVIGMPFPFVCLCHCLSGGLPRDLIRVCRNLVIEARNGSKNQLRELCSSILRADFASKLHAIETAAGELSIGSDLANFIELLHTLDLEATERWEAITNELKTIIDIPDGDESDEVGASYAKFNALRAELGIYLTYTRLIYEFFVRSALTRADIERAEKEGTMEDLANLRQSFSLNHSFADLLAHKVVKKLLPADRPK